MPLATAARKHGKRGAPILRRPEYSGSGKLHRSVAHAVYGTVLEPEGAGR